MISRLRHPHLYLHGPAWPDEVPFATPPDITSSANGANDVFAADIDGDGDLDVVSTSRSDNTTAWHANINGDGSSWSTTIIDNNGLNAPRATSFADIDGDGDLDVLLAGGATFLDGMYYFENPSWTQRTITSGPGSGITSIVALLIRLDSSYFSGLPCVRYRPIADTLLWISRCYLLPFPRLAELRRRSPRMHGRPNLLLHLN